MTSEPSEKSDLDLPRHRGGRPQRRSPQLAGGAPLAFSIIIGVLVGGLLGQPSIGLLVGVAVGAGIALIIWRLNDQTRPPQ